MAGEEWTALVTFESEGLVVGVVRDRAGGIWLTGELTAGGGTLLEDFSPAIEGWDDRTVVGGLLPPGAVAAEVEDRSGEWHEAAAGGGAWVTVLEEPAAGEEPIARYLDARGRIARSPLPQGVEVEPITDAVDACPVCQALEWHRVVRAVEGRYGSDGRGNPTAAVCGSCGYEVNLGVLVRPSEIPIVQNEMDLEHAERAEAEALEEQRDEALLSRVDFPVYEFGAAWTRERALGGYGGQSPGPREPLMRVTRVTLRFGKRGEGREWADVTSDVEELRESDDEAAYQALRSMLDDAAQWPSGLSDPALLLWFRAREREERIAAAHAEPFRHVIPVDGDEVAFAGRSAGDLVAAAATVKGVQISIAGRIDLGQIEIRRTKSLARYGESR